MKPFKQLASVFAALLLLFSGTGIASAATTASNNVVVPVVFNIAESVSLTTNSTGIVLTNAAPTASIVLTASWQIKSGHTSATIYSWFSVLPVGGSTTIPSNDFSTTFNGGAPVVCNQILFQPGNIGVGGRNCGTFVLTQNVASDLNDSVPVSFSLTAAPATFNLTPNTYSGGVLNLLLSIS